MADARPYHPKPPELPRAVRIAYERRMAEHRVALRRELGYPVRPCDKRGA